MTIGILKESPGENRVALLPESVATLGNLNVSLVGESGAGGTACGSEKQCVVGGAFM